MLGLDVVKHPTEVRRRMGYVFGGERGVRLSGWFETLSRRHASLERS